MKTKINCNKRGKILRFSHPLMRFSRPLERFYRPLMRFSYPLERFSRPLMRFSHPLMRLTRFLMRLDCLSLRFNPISQRLYQLSRMVHSRRRSRRSEPFCDFGNPVRLPRSRVVHSARMNHSSLCLLKPIFHQQGCDELIILLSGMGINELRTAVKPLQHLIPFNLRWIVR